MVQYGYADYITAEKLVDFGRVTSDGLLAVKNRRYRTLVTLFEPFPSPGLISLIRRLLQQGGRVIWSGPPPFLSDDRRQVLPEWQELFGISYAPAGHPLGLPASGRRIQFSGILQSVPDQVVITNSTVDRIYPFTLGPHAEPLAKVGDWLVGAVRSVGERKGVAVALGFRPRDDQSQSLGEEVRTWFEILVSLGAYPATGAFANENDNPEYISRTTPWLANKFPNGAIVLAPHFRTYEEGWHGGFHRDAEQDAKWLAEHPVPPGNIDVKDVAVHGSVLTFCGTGAVGFRLDARGNLIAFAGSDCSEVSLNGVRFRFSDSLFRHIAWSPVPSEQRVPYGAVIRFWLDGEGSARMPLPKPFKPLDVVAQGALPGSRGEPVRCSQDDESIVMDIQGGQRGRWLYGIPRA
jgi:hypothetical protein